MAKKPYQAPTYGFTSTMEEEMRAKGQGVYANKMEPAPANKDAAPALSSMTKAQLVETADAEGVAYESDDNKADLVRKIEKARKG